MVVFICSAMLAACGLASGILAGIASEKREGKTYDVCLILAAVFVVAAIALARFA